jgi:hypothetical protein
MVWVLPVVVMRGVFGNGFPPLAIVQLHPVVFSVIHLAAVFQGLSKESTKEVIVGCVLKTKVSHVAQVLVELICVPWLAIGALHNWMDAVAYREILRKAP